MNDFRTLSDTMLASPQITLSDLKAAKERGVTLVINNRPEGESPDQTPGPEIEAAALAAGMQYVAIPIDHSGFSPAQVEAMHEALSKAEGKVLAYCRSGTRSTFLWSLAHASDGAEPGSIMAAAAAAGYDVSPIAGLLQQLADGRGG
ncbi:TIGR01244 family phosphatase [Altererythrobacter salegens]|uniref:TIGR01244 family phosphatase n=1 Tax=Croceibacterium salegens TaxID=1737568 RepID=A0A6I4SWD1_9SPHN|nr:TIGR01244 family sulfur transferase [Croceibacterium salegens]MXO60311.1 TIGR01244 family phosphatase [Croceibacterium salegens]